MFHANAVFIVVLLINNILLQCCPPSYAYTQVAVDGSSSSSSGSSDGPKIYKAVNFDLIFPKSFNSTENVISTTPETIIASPPKTAVVGQAFYPLIQTNERPPPYNHQPEAVEEEIPATATIDNDKQQPTLYITPPPSLSVYEADSDTQAAAVAETNEAAVIYERHQNTNDNNYNYNNGPQQVVTPNPINIQQQQQQHQWKQYEAEQQQQQHLNVNNKARTILQEQKVEQEQQQQQQNLATGRAVDYQSGYPFGQLITPLIKNTPQPVYRKPVASYTTYPLTRKTAASSSLASGSNVGKIIYPQAMYQRKSPSQAEIDKLRGKDSFRDRFSPSEGVASFNLKNNHDHSHDHSHDHNHAPAPSKGGGGGKTASAFNTINSFAAPTNLYSFPPNNINYPKLNQDSKLALPSGQVNSYSPPASGSPLKYNLYNKGKVNSYTPPASGPLNNANYNLITAGSNNSPYQYNGPVSTSYLPAIGSASDAGANDSAKGGNDGGGDGDIVSDSGDDTVGVLPASAMDQLNIGKDTGGKDMGDDMSSDDMGGGDMPGEEGKANDDHSYDTGKEYPTPPPGWLEEHPESAHSPHDHDHDHEHHHDQHPDIIYDHDHYHHDVYPSFPSFPIYPSYPHLIYHDHDHHHLPEVEPPAPMAMTTEEPPPPPPPEPKPEPRVKKYSYFYIGRKLWYIPLYFTIWFSFYVLWLILKSIARHKVQLPNHYTGDLPNRYVNRRSLDSYDFSEIKQATLNDLTVSVLDKIDQFREKYLNGN